MRVGGMHHYGDIMRSLFLALLLALTSIPLLHAQDLLLKNARIVDPAAQQITTGAIVIRNGAIAEVLPAAPESFNGTVLDLAGKWVIPGLNDMHVHSFGNVAPKSQMQLLGTEESARVMLYCGVTGFLDLFSSEDEILALRNRQRTSGLLAADIYCSGPILTCPGGHGTEYGIPTRVMRNPEEAVKMVDELAAKKPDVVKISYDHGYEQMPSIDRPTMEAAVKAARRHGIKTVVHIGNWNDALEAVNAGASSITHIYHRGVVPDTVVAAMKQNGVYLIPTLAVENDLLNFYRQPEILKRPLLSEVASASLIDAYSDSSKLERRLKEWLAVQRHGEKDIFTSVTNLDAANVEILAGTDAGNPGTFQGYSLHRELELLVKGGLTPWEALAAATTKAGAFLGREFNIRPGAVANLVVLDASPIDDIVNTQKIASVIYRGKVVDRKELLHPTTQPWTIALLDNFDKGAGPIGPSISGGEWIINLDSAWGGSSTAKSYREKGTLHVEGTLGPRKGMPGIAGVALVLDSTGAARDVSAYDGVRITIKATKGSLSMKLITKGVKNYDYHAAAIENKKGFQTIEIPFSQFRQQWSAQMPWTGKDVQGIAIWATSFNADKFEFTIDSIELYKKKTK